MKKPLHLFVVMACLASGTAFATSPTQEAPLRAPAEGSYWNQLPQVRFPMGALTKHINSGRVVLSCVVRADGRVANCRVVSEDPVGAGFGEEALRAVASARLTRAAVAANPPGQRVTFPMTWRMSG